MTPHEADVEADPAQGRATRSAWLAAGLLMVAYALSWMDRNLPAILIEPMKRDLAATDTQLALLTGFAFAVCHATLTVPLSWLADRWDRARLIMLGVLVWSAMTFACGFAPNFKMLFLARMGVGLGEAVLLPAAYSLIADLFPREQRPKALMIFVLGSPIGSALALSAGGNLHGYFDSQSPGWIGDLSAWRATFATVGALGVMVALLMLALPEPRRRRAGTPVVAPPAEKGDTAAFLSYLRAAAFFLVPAITGITLFNLFVNGFFAWLPPLFDRSFGWPLPTVGSALGTAVLVAGILGAPLGAYLAGSVSRWRQRDAAVTVMLLAAAVIAPFAVFAPIAGSSQLAFAGVGITLLFTAAAAVVAPLTVVNTAPAPIRARVSAVYLLIANLVGSGGGATVFALSTDYLFRDASRLGESMALVSAVLLGSVLIFLFIAHRRYDSALRLSGEPPAYSRTQSRGGVHTTCGPRGERRCEE